MNMLNFFSILRGNATSKLPQRQPSYTKSGPGRKHKQGDGSRTSEQKQAGSFGRGLRNHFARLNHQRLVERRNKRKASAS